MIAIRPSSSDQTCKGPFAIQYHLRTSVLRRAFARAKRLLLAGSGPSTLHPTVRMPHLPFPAHDEAFHQKAGPG
jgi:hypothetical protein